MPSLLGSEEHTSELQSPCNLVCRLFLDRKSTRLNSSHLVISYAVFCLKKKKTESRHDLIRCFQEMCSTRAATTKTASRNYNGNITSYHVFFFFLMIGRPPRSPLFPNPTLFR